MKIAGLKIYCLFLVLALLVAFAVGCGQSKSPGGADQKPAGKAESVKKQDLAIATSSTGGTGFMYGTAVAKVINENVSNFSAKAIATAGVIENDRLLRSGEADIIVALPVSAYESFTGKGNFAKVFSQIGPYKDLKAMWWMYGTLLQCIVPADSNIKSYADLKGKKVGMGMPGSTAYISGTGVLEAYGVKLDQITPRQMSVEEMSTGLKDGTVDAVITMMGADTPSFKDLSNVRNVRWLPVGKAEYDNFNSKWPAGTWMYGKLPAGSFKGQNEDVPTLVGPLILATNNKLSEEAVYNITKAFWEHLDSAYSVHPVVKESTVDFSFTTSPPIPWHPGVLKYLEEKKIKYSKYQAN